MLAYRCLQMKWWAVVTVVAIPSQKALLMCPYISSGKFSVHHFWWKEYFPFSEVQFGRHRVSVKIELVLGFDLPPSSHPTLPKNCQCIYFLDGFYERKFQASICKPIDSASSILPNLWLQFTCFVHSFQDLFVFHLVQTPLPGFFQTGSGAFLAAPSARGYWRYDISDKSPRALCTSKAILDFHFLEITSWLGPGLLNCNRQNLQ